MRSEMTRERLVECLKRMQEAASADEPLDVPAPPFIESMTVREVCEWDVELYRLAIRALDQEAAAKAYADARTLRPSDSWREEDGNVVWWFIPVCEPPYVGTPLDDDFPDHVTHWTRLAVPDCAGESGGSDG